MLPIFVSVPVIYTLPPGCTTYTFSNVETDNEDENHDRVTKILLYFKKSTRSSLKIYAGGEIKFC